MKSVKSARQRMLQYPQALAKCATQVTAYGKCVSSKENLKKSDCLKEFETLRDCVKSTASEVSACFWITLGDFFSFDVEVVSMISQLLIFKVGGRCQFPSHFLIWTSRKRPQCMSDYIPLNDTSYSKIAKHLHQKDNSSDSSISFILRYLQSPILYFPCCVKIWLEVASRKVMFFITRVVSSYLRTLTINQCVNASVQCYSVNIKDYQYYIQDEHNFLSYQTCRHMATNTRAEEKDKAFTKSTIETIPLPRCQHLAAILKCNIEEVKALSEKHTFLNHMSPELIKEKMFIMSSFGLSYKWIRQHLRVVYQTSSQELHRRLQLLEKHQFLNELSFFKHRYLGSYLECKVPYFDYALQNLCVQRDALEGCPHQQAYLQYRLQCSEAQACLLLKSYPLNRQVSNVKLKELLDFFLLEAGRTPEFVIKHTKFLSFSVERLRTRWEVMQVVGIQSETSMIHIWCLSKNKFKNAYSKFIDPES